jgi:integrase
MAKQHTELPIKVGRIRIVAIASNLGIRFSLDYKDYRIGKLGAINPDNIKTAIAKAQAIDSDISLGLFDTTLAKYSGATRNVSVKPDKPINENPIDVLGLWDKFVAYKLDNGAKAKTVDAWLTIRKNLVKAKVNDYNLDAIKIKSQLMSVTTEQQTRRALQHLSACFDFGVRFNLATTNPFKGMSDEMVKPAYVTDPKPNAFTETEMNEVIEAFKTSKKYSHFATFIEFLFLTGCRPSEACGLLWESVASDFSTVKFERSLQNLNGEVIIEAKSKTNRVRLFPCNDRLRALLQEIKPIDCSSQNLVFTGIKGGAINYRYFSDKPFQLARNIKLDCTPYNCRDTFISLQLLKGVPSAVIAKWCDTSTTMIDKYYTDAKQFLAVLPK